jgi:hypothetical protein
LTELEALLASAHNNAYLLETARRAQVNYVLDESNVREWFTMIRDQVRVVSAAG